MTSMKLQMYDKLDFDMHSVHDTVILSTRPGIGQNASCAVSDIHKI